jgi:hypothetical protein
MSLSTILSTAKTGEIKKERMITWRQLPQYILCAILGLLGGAAGVALAIGLAIVSQLLLSPAVVFSPGVVLLALVAVVAGMGVSWLLSRLVRLIWPDLFYTSAGQGIQVMLIVSTFTSLLQTFLFMHGL